MAQRVPCLNDHAMRFQICLEFRLLVVRVNLGLQNCGLHLADGEDFFHLFNVEIGQANGPDFPLFVGFFHLAIPGDIIACGLVNQQQVNIICVQTGQRLVYCIGILVEAGPQLGFKENFLALQARGFHGPAHSLFIHIGVGSIDQRCTTVQGADNSTFSFVRGQQKGSDALGGHFHAIIQSDIFHR